MNQAALLLGSNQGNSQATIEKATELIQQRIGPVVAFSRQYFTKPWGNFGDEEPADFLNQALLVDTVVNATETLRQCLLIEAELGRKRLQQTTSAVSGRTYSSRTIDIDIIFFNDQVIEINSDKNGHTLFIPHPRAHLRRFVLEPLCDIMPNYVHPQLNLSLAELLSNVE